MTKEQMCDKLMEDYGEYLSDLSHAELKLVVKNGVFTLRQAKLEVAKSKLHKNKDEFTRDENGNALESI
jgi:hypothetical protein